jgi:hypothetical protein
MGWRRGRGRVGFAVTVVAMEMVKPVFGITSFETTPEDRIKLCQVLLPCGSRRVVEIYFLSIEDLISQLMDKIFDLRR